MRRRRPRGHASRETYKTRDAVILINLFIYLLQFMAQKTTEANGCNAKESRTPY